MFTRSGLPVVWSILAGMEGNKGRCCNTRMCVCACERAKEQVSLSGKTMPTVRRCQNLEISRVRIHEGMGGVSWTSGRLGCGWNLVLRVSGPPGGCAD